MGLLGNLFGGERKALEAALLREQIEAAKLNTDVLRQRNEAVTRAYEAAQSSQYWPKRGDAKSGNAAIEAAGSSLRQWSRYLDENHDLVVGIFDELTKKIVGCGARIEPMVRGPDGKLNMAANLRLRELWKDWTQSMPESSRTLTWSMVEALACRSLFRDGEFMVQHLDAGAPIKHRAQVPYSIEIIEADYLPFDLYRVSTPTQNRITHGVELTDWREPVAYYMYREHPGDVGMLSSTGISGLITDYKRVSADNITHAKFVRRFGQVRGVPILHACLRRIEDIKEYEESERVAARVAAAFCAVITRSTDFQGMSSTDSAGSRIMEMNPGMIFDQLLPGEDVKTIGSNRPNANLEPFRNSQIRAVAAGTGTSFSSVSRSYNGSWSSQRQELVDCWTGYEMAQEMLFGMFHRPVWKRFVTMAVAAGLVPVKGVDMQTLFAADITGPAMPWIDPTKEVEAQGRQVAYGFKSRHMVIRENQYDPADVDAQIETDPLKGQVASAKPIDPVQQAQATDTQQTQEAAAQAA